MCGRGKKSSAKEQALGRSRGGFSTKVHALTDALGYPIKFILTGGQESDIGQAENLLTGIEAGALLADKGYDADVLLESLKKNSVDAVIAQSTAWGRLSTQSQSHSTAPL